MKKLFLLSLLVLQTHAAISLRDQGIPEDASASSNQSYNDDQLYDDQSYDASLAAQAAVIAPDQSGDYSSLDQSTVDTTSSSYTGVSMDQSSTSEGQTVIIVSVDQTVDSSADASATVTAPACTGLCPLRPWCNALLARLSPAGLGVVSGVSLACLETELVSPLLANFSDPVAIGIELGFFGALGYAAYTNEDNETIQELKTSKALLGMLAGIIVWNSLHS